MTFKFRHIGLSIGLVCIILSFLFFARQQSIYNAFLIGGLLISLTFFLTIVFSKDTKKTKFIWVAMVVLSVIVQRFTEPFLIDSSYRIYIGQNKSDLTEINSILLQKPGDISVMRDTIFGKSGLLTTDEIAKLKDLREKINSYGIFKSDKHIYFGLWGFLDVRLGVIYWAEDTKPDNRYRHLIDKWYH